LRFRDYFLLNFRKPNPRIRAIKARRICSAHVSGSIGDSGTTVGTSPDPDVKRTHSLC